MPHQSQGDKGELKVPPAVHAPHGVGLSVKSQQRSPFTVPPLPPHPKQRPPRSHLTPSRDTPGAHLTPSARSLPISVLSVLRSHQPHVGTAQA